MIQILWALTTLGVAIAAGTIVDDSETDKISYSDGWLQCPGSDPVCMGGRLEAARNNTVHQYVRDTTYKWPILTALGL